MVRLPHPIPYQGSKRNLAPLIGRYVPARIDTWFEPFGGSAAMTIWAAHRKLARHYVIGDSLEPIADLWRAILTSPKTTADRYEEIWKGQFRADLDYFYLVRKRYNVDRDPVDLLYLICRCVKNAIRFSARGLFTQSVDRRRLGMQPDKMRTAIMGTFAVLKDKTEVRAGDWMNTLHDASSKDFVYMDPPYLGTSTGPDRRYAEQISQEKLIDGLKVLKKRRIRFALSYDGMTGTKEYGPPLPPGLGLTRLLLHAGTSSQATLNGHKAETIESLYLSHRPATALTSVIRVDKPVQERLNF